jgi:uncharacterized protein (DUF885 family)
MARATVRMLFAFQVCCAVSNPVLQGQDPAVIPSQFSDLLWEFERSWDARHPLRAASEADRNVDLAALTLEDNSRPGTDRWNSVVDAAYDRLVRIDREALASFPESRSFVHLRQALESERALRACRLELWSFDWIRELAAAGASIENSQRTPEVSNAADGFLARVWRSLPAYLEREQLNLREGLRLGYVATTVQVSGALEALQELGASIEAKPGESSLIWSAAQLEARPSLETYGRFLRESYATQARIDPRLSALPTGVACYEAKFHEATSLSLGLDSIRTLGIALFDERAAMIHRVVRDRWGDSADASAIFSRLYEDSTERFTDSAEVLASARAILARASRLGPRWLPMDSVPGVRVNFLRQPGINVGRYLPPASERDSADIVLHSVILDLPRAALERVVVHEGVPGHHIDFVLAAGKEPAPGEERFGMTRALREGWAEYANIVLAEEMGLYSSPEAILFGLRSNPPAILVAEVGLHFDGWTLEQAGEFISRYGFMPPKVAQQYAVMLLDQPGRTVAYPVGVGFIMQLRRRAERSLGPRFDLRRFHAIVLDQRAGPLTGLRDDVEDWIAAELKQ